MKIRARVAARVSRHHRLGHGWAATGGLLKRVGLRESGLPGSGSPVGPGDSAFEREVQLGGFAVLDRKLQVLGLQLAVVSLDLVLSRGQALDLEGAVLLGD